MPGPEETRPHWAIERAAPRNEQMATNKVECNACPVLCQISEGRAGACDRYANQGGCSFASIQSCGCAGGPVPIPRGMRPKP